MSEIQVKNWIESIVIKLNLCPFAHAVYSKDQILYLTSSFTSLIDICQSLTQLALEINSTENDYSTALLILSEGLEDFDEFISVFNIVEEYIAKELKNEFQMASFHPKYEFQNEEELTAFTNRSPFPIFHLLKTNDVEEAISNHPDTAQIPENNKLMMRKLGIMKLRELFSKM